jgi:hypothetical protein
VTDSSSQLRLSSRPPDSSTTTYNAGSKVVEAQVHTYYLKADAATETYQLMHYDGSANADVPVADHVVGLHFDYYGDPQAPILTSAGPTFGLNPPALGVRTTAYPAGENCTFQVDADSGLQVSRLAALNTTRTLTNLTAAQLTDGPWCPDATNANRWDADLLRIRMVGVTVRVEAAAAALRGPAGVLFANGGSSRTASKWVPDQEIRFEIAPRNLNLSR